MEKIIWKAVGEESKCYDIHKLSQASECIRFSSNWESNNFTIIMKNNRFNFEVKFKENPDKIKDLPFVDEILVQKNLKLLFDEIDSMYEKNYDFNQLFQRVRNKVMFDD